jgi:ribonuclease HI
MMTIFITTNIYTNKPPTMPTYDSSSSKKKTYFYAVGKGRVPGIYNTWEECKSQVQKFQGAKYKKFETEQEATDFVGLWKYETKSILSRFGVQPQPQPDADATVTKDHSTTQTTIKEPKSHIISCFTDGSCLKNGKKSSGESLSIGAYAVHFSDDTLSKYDMATRLEGTREKPVTNNRCEIMGVITAIIQTNENIDKDRRKVLEIYTDSKYTIDCMEKWIKNWLRNGWVNAKKQPVENRDLLERLNELMKTRIVRLKWIASHQPDIEWKHIHNNIVDRMANQLISSI